jgi:EpsI family protein
MTTSIRHLGRQSLPLWIAAALMAATVTLAHVREPEPSAPPAAPFAKLLPERFGDWRIDTTMIPVAPTPDVQQALDQIYDEIVSRTYVNSANQRIMVVVAYGGDQSDGLKAHRQEVCYTAQGFKIDSVTNDRIALAGHNVPVVRVQSHKDDRYEPMSYWFMMGDKVRLSRAGRLLSQIQYGLQGQIPDGLLVRVSSVDKDAAAAFKTQDAFIAQLLQNVDAATRMRLVGLD